MEIVESNGIVKYIWMEVTTAPCLAVPTIEESQKGNNSAQLCGVLFSTFTLVWSIHSFVTDHV